MTNLPGLNPAMVLVMVLDPGTVDSVAMDPGTVDSVAMDPGTVDSVVIDPGTVDSVVIDPGTVDSGTIDPGTVDSVAMGPGTMDPHPGTAMTMETERVIEATFAFRAANACCNPLFKQKKKPTNPARAIEPTHRSGF